MAASRRHTRKKNRPADPLAPPRENRAELRKAGVSFLWVLGVGIVFMVLLAIDAPRQLLMLTGLGLLVTVTVLSWHLSWAFHTWLLDEGQHTDSACQRRIKLLVAVVLTFTLSMTLIASGLQGWAEGVAPALSRHGAPISQETSPKLFWLSISLRIIPSLLMIGLLAWGLSRHVLRKIRKTREAPPSP